MECQIIRKNLCIHQPCLLRIISKKKKKNSNKTREKAVICLYLNLTLRPITPNYASLSSLATVVQNINTKNEVTYLYLTQSGRRTEVPMAEKVSYFTGLERRWNF